MSGAVLWTAADIVLEIFLRHRPRLTSPQSDVAPFAPALRPGSKSDVVSNLVPDADQDVDLTLSQDAVQDVVPDVAQDVA